MKKSKSRLIVSLLTVFMMVFSVIPYIGASPVEADSDPYVYENPAWNGDANSTDQIVKTITYIPQQDNTFGISVHIDVSHIDYKNDVSYLEYEYRDSSGETHWKLVEDIGNNDFIKASFACNLPDLGIVPGKEWRIRFYITDQNHGSWQDFDNAYITLTAPQLKTPDVPEATSRYTEVTVEKSNDGSYYIHNAKYEGDDTPTKPAIYRENLSTGKFMCVTREYEYAWDSNNMKPDTEYKYYVVNQNHLKETGYPTGQEEISISAAAKAELNKYAATATIKTDPIKVANVTNLKVYKKGLKYAELRWYHDGNGVVPQGYAVHSFDAKGKLLDTKYYADGRISGNNIYVTYKGTTTVAVTGFVNASDSSTIYGETAYIYATSAKLASPSVNITKISNKNSRITVYKKGDGIQVQQKVGKKWKSVTSGSKAATYKKTWKKNNAGKTSYRVRAYIKDQGKTYYTSWKTYKPKSNYRTYTKRGVSYMRNTYAYGDVFFLPTKIEYKGSKIKVTGRFYNTWKLASDSGKFKITYKADGKTIGYKTISVKNMEANSYKTTTFYLSKAKKNADLRCASYTLKTIK